MSNHENHRRGGPGRRFEKGRKPKKVSAKASAVITAQIVADRKKRGETAFWRKWRKSADFRRWLRHGKWKAQSKGSKGLKKKRIRVREKMLEREYKALAKARLGE